MSRAMTIAPSRIARTVAAAEWPDVQAQYKLADGVFGFTCAGHGGIVAVIGVADIPEHAIEIARKHNLIELVAHVRNGRRTRTYTSEKYTKDSLRELAAQRPDVVTLFEVWVGEEDCGWATIMAANPAFIPGAIKGGYLSEHVDFDTVVSSLENWNPDFLAAMEGRNFYVREHRDYSKPEGEHITFRVFKLGDDNEPLAIHADLETAQEDARNREFAGA